MDPWPTISDLAAQQYGRLSTRQLRGAGLDDATLSRVARAQQWERPHRGVYAPVGSFEVPEARLAAALLAVGPPVLIAGWGAAWLWGLVPAAPTVPEVVVPHQRKAGRDARLVLRRSRTLLPSDGVVLRGLPVTTPARTLCDLAALTDEPALRGLLIDARQRRLADLADVAACAARMGTAAGGRLLRELLRELDQEHCDSVLEHRMRRRLAEVGGLPPPDPRPVEVHTPHAVLHVDIAWPGWRVGLEVDGLGSHSERKSLEIDARRHNALQLAGWCVLRATWADLGPAGDALFVQLRSLLANGSSFLRM